MTDTTADISAEIDEIWSRHEAARDETEDAPQVDAVEADAVEAAEAAEAAEGAGPERGPDGKFKAKEAAEAAAEEKQPEAKVEDGAEEGEEKAEAKPKEDAPGSLPKPIRDAWGKLTPEVREAFKSSQDTMARKLSEVTRVNNALQPIQSKLAEASKTIPQLLNMTPEKVADEVFQMAQWSAALQRSPVEALMQLAKHHGATDALAKQLAGEKPDAAALMQQELAEMKRQLATATDPSRLDERISQRTHESTVEREVVDFSRSKADWEQVEPHMPKFVEIASQMNEGFSNVEILEAAYDMAVNAIPALRASQVQPKPAPNPEKTQAALAAKKVNVKPSGSGGSSPTTDRQAMEHVWQKHYG